MKINFRNHKQVKARLARLMPDVQRAVQSEMTSQLKQIHSEVNEPVRSGDLKATGRVNEAERKRDKITGSIGYGRQNKAHYAAPVEAKKPYLAPAANDAAKERMRAALVAAILKAGKK